MRLISIAALLSLAAALAVAQDKGTDAKGKDCSECCQEKKDCCGSAGFICPKEGKCEGACKDICDQVGATCKAVCTTLMERCKKEFGKTCCDGKEAKAGDKCCEGCAMVKTKILAPMFKARLGDCFKAMEKDKAFKPVHSITTDGKTTEVACTLMVKGPVCTTCVAEISDAAWKQLMEMSKSGGCCEGEKKETPKQ